MSKKIVIANWKAHPQSLEQAKDLFRASSGAIVCPPFVYLEELSKIDSGAVLGAQDIESGETLKKFGVKYVIVGHSDRRWKLGESDEIVNKKLRLALEYDITPIVCIGEKVRDKGFRDFLKNQVESTFAGLFADQIEKCLVVYEPVWAISTTPGSRPDTPESAVESINIIKEVFSLKFKVQNPKFLYGGSVTSANAGDFLSLNEFSGVLVGGASLKKEEFAKILSLA